MSKGVQHNNIDFIDLNIIATNIPVLINQFLFIFKLEESMFWKYFTFGGGYILVTKVRNFPTSFFNMNLFNNILFRSDNKNKCIAPADELFQNEYKN